MNNMKTFCIATLMMVICSFGKGQEVPTNDTIKQLLDRLDTVIQKEQIPGLMVAIVKKDSILFAGGLGFSDLSQQRPVDKHTQFHLASITKFFVAMGIQQLVASGKLKLTDRIQDIAPEIPITNRWEETDPVRVIHLLEHTAGLSDIQINSMINISGKPLTGIEAIRAVSNSLTVRWKPGVMMSYSNPGYNVLGYILEKVSGMPWDKYLQQTTFTALDMNNTLFDLDGKKQPNFATGYNFQNGEYQPMPFYIPSGNGASSALVSTAEDMARFMHYLLNGSPDSTLLGQADLKEMETNHSTLASQAGLQTGYALGNDLFPNNKKVSFRGHNGKGEGFVSWILYNREAGLAYAIAANNIVYMWPVSQAIEEFLTNDISAPDLVDVPIDEDSVAPMLGHYQFMNPKNERWDFHRRIFGDIELKDISGNKLIVNRGSGQIDSLIHEGGGIFRLKDDILPYFILSRDPDGQPFFQGQGNNFYRKVSYASILIQKIPIYLGLAAILIYVLYSLVGIFLTLFHKMKLVELCIPLVPVLGVIAFLSAFRTMGLTDASNKELFASFNWTSFSIFAGMLLFAISVIVSSFLLYQRWSQLNYRWSRIPLAFSNFFLCYLVVLLTIHGWIGVPIWLM